ncbi:unnamed protein product [Adineta steineri]|uniref:NAD(P)(+)--arginine ADP-ribosyltransferase n=2 Tax=Adineta steineri TaxID=433720 RepID=A0A814V3P3_9BILA|nr:unnamed protein product [Adineta steineri]
MNCFSDIDCSFKKLTPVYGFHVAKLVPIEEALQSVESQIDELPYFIKIAKKHCHYPSEHGLTHDESASIYIYTMEWGEQTLYRVLNKTLRNENRDLLKVWFAYIKLLDTALNKLPTVKEVVWRGITADVGKTFHENDKITWWSINSCSSKVNVIKGFLGNKSNSTMFLIEALNGKKVSGYTQFESEDEIILKMGTEFRVKSNALDHPNGLYVVHLIEIDDDYNHTTLASSINQMKLTTNQKSSIQKSMTDKTIKVFFEQFGETVYVPMSLVSTIEDVIKYVCQTSLRTMDIDYNNYYLASKKNDEMLDNNKTLEEANILAIDDPDLRLSLKKAIRERLRMVTLKKLSENQDKIGINPQTQPDDIQCKNIDFNNATSTFDCSEGTNSNELMFNDEKSAVLNKSEYTPISENLETNNSNPSPGLPTPSLPAQDVSSKDAVNVLQKEDLAHNYQKVQKKIKEISEKITRDPVLRQKIVERFNEINIVVCGSPRVGKSTLINAICQQNLAKTHPGLHSCTNITSPYYLKGNTTVGDENINYQYNFWDTPGFENWDHAGMPTCLERIKQKIKSDIICIIYCTSPGSFANLRQLDWLLEECKKLHIFCALVCTNKWKGFKEQREAVMRDFQETLEKYHTKTREENGTIYFGNMGLCTSVNSLPIKDEETHREYKQSGINELISGIMQSIDMVKAAQWFMVAFENEPF